MEGVNKEVMWVMQQRLHSKFSLICVYKRYWVGGGWQCIYIISEFMPGWTGGGGRKGESWGIRRKRVEDNS